MFLKVTITSRLKPLKTPYSTTRRHSRFLSIETTRISAPVLYRQKLEYCLGYILVADNIERSYSLLRSVVVSESQAKEYSRTDRPVETHSGARGNILAGPLYGKFFWIFLFEMAHSGVLYIFERRRAPKCCGARGNLPPTPPFRRACEPTRKTDFSIKWHQVG